MAYVSREVIESDGVVTFLKSMVSFGASRFLKRPIEDFRVVSGGKVLFSSPNMSEAEINYRKMTESTVITEQLVGSGA